jgi:GH25 family lysozyme M1 (1,4-beta-N-acetylmuramidase)
MPFGAYHFARPSVGDAKTEARFFIDVANPVPGDLRPCLDLETTEGLSMTQIKTWADEFCAEVERLTSVTPLVYTPFLLSASLERRALFWVPRYNNDNDPPIRSWDIWQFSNGVFGVPNRVNGLGNVDLNHSKVDLKDLLIPKAAEPVLTRGRNVDSAIKDLTAAEKKAKDGTDRDSRIKRSLQILKRIAARSK